ncbi:acetoacetate decarboxylase family protein [Aliikangiella maris]|uniref:Acetoacetate decarboxylase family protein n=2 Tax=Aliikangiella maris TaxID=3162458 RepID=A0ABV2BQE1_9GAMM
MLTENYAVRENESLFKGYPRQPHPFMLGKQGEHEFLFPTYFYKSRLMSAGFLCDFDVAKKMLPPGLRPLKVLPGKAVVGFTCYQHVQIAEMEPYNEAVISIPSVRQNGTKIPFLPLLMEEKFRSFGHYVYHMPVNSQLNQARGEYIWGLPKVVAEVNFLSENGMSICEVKQHEQLVFRLRVPMQGKATKFDRAMQVFSVLDEKLLSTESRVNALMQINKSPFKPDFAQVELGDHMVAQRIAELGELTRCMESRYTDDLRSILSLPNTLV